MVIAAGLVYNPTCIHLDKYMYGVTHFFLQVTSCSELYECGCCCVVVVLLQVVPLSLLLSTGQYSVTSGKEALQKTPVIRQLLAQHVHMSSRH